MTTPDSGAVAAAGLRRGDPVRQANRDERDEQSGETAAHLGSGMALAYALPGERRQRSTRARSIHNTESTEQHGEHGFRRVNPFGRQLTAP